MKNKNISKKRKEETKADVYFWSFIWMPTRCSNSRVSTRMAAWNGSGGGGI